MVKMHKVGMAAVLVGLMASAGTVQAQEYNGSTGAAPVQTTTTRLSDGEGGIGRASDVPSSDGWRQVRAERGGAGANRSASPSTGSSHSCRSTNATLPSRRSPVGSGADRLIGPWKRSG